MPLLKYFTFFHVSFYRNICVYGVNKVKVMKFEHSKPSKTIFYHDEKDTAVIQITVIIW